MRRFVVVSSALFVALLAGPVSGASAIPNPATGSITCGAAWGPAVMHFIPALSNTGTSTSEEIEIKATIKTCAGGTPPSTSGLLVGKGVITGPAGRNKCAVFFAGLAGTRTFAFSSQFTAVINWTPTANGTTKATFPVVHVISPSVASAGNGPVTFTTPGGTAFLSYAGAATQTMKTVKTYNMIRSGGAGDCG